MQRNKYWFLAAGVLWGAFVLFWPRSSGHDESAKSQAAKDNDGLYITQITQAPLGMLGANFYESVLNKKRWNVRSRFAELHRKENYAFLQEVSALFFADRTGNQIDTTSDYGRSYLDKQAIELEGNVTIRSRRGYLFEMPRLGYDGKAHLFHTEENVEMRGPNVERPAMFLRGKGLTGNIDTEHFVLRHNVTARKMLKSSEWIKIVSRAGEFFTEDQRAVFKGSVRSSLPKVELQSDEMELSIVKDKESIEARGNVHLNRRETRGSANQAYLEMGSNRIVLEGNAKVDSRDNEIRGKRIVLYTDDERVEVEGAEGRMSQ